jgi:asparaginyl-tRNA synthetase
MLRKGKLYGSLKSVRSGKKFTFLQVKYGDCQVQAVIPTKEYSTIPIESFIELDGVKRDLPEGKYSTQDYEFDTQKITVLSISEPDVHAKCPKDASIDVQLRERHFYFRQEHMISIIKLSDLLCQSFRAYFSKQQMTELDVPMFTGVECEGGATLFKLQHPGKTSEQDTDAFLTQSSQFALELALPGIGDCYCIAKSFRAERSHTRRHLTEFTHVETEWGCILDFQDHVDKLQQMLVGVISEFLVIAKKELVKIYKYERVQSLLRMCEDVLILTHREAIEKCRELGIKKDDGSDFGDRDDIPESQERKLIDTIGRIVFLTKFPQEFKSFYMALDKEDPSYVLGCDVEVPGVGEIIGSGVRESDYGRLLDRLVSQGLEPDDYREYLDLRKSGFCMTSGMGLGLGRMLCWFLEEDSIRSVVPFPRYPGYLRP